MQLFNTNSKGGQKKPESICKINYCQVSELSVYELQSGWKGIKRLTGKTDLFKHTYPQ